jgi:hypothetical protein
MMEFSRRPLEPEMRLADSPGHDVSCLYEIQDKAEAYATESGYNCVAGIFFV